MKSDAHVAVVARTMLNATPDMALQFDPQEQALYIAAWEIEEERRAKSLQL